MLIINSISLIALLSMLIYIICFICRYRIVPQSLSVTAEYNGRYQWWRITICSIMGWLGYWFPTVYPLTVYGFYPILASAGLAGLALAGYFPYSPWEETKFDLTVHKIGSSTGAVCICLFYLLCFKLWEILLVLGFCLILGISIKGKRYNYPSSNSIVFWEEIGIICIIGYDIILKFHQELIKI